MKKIVLISTDESPAAMGVKVLSSNLIKYGFETTIVIMANWEDDYRSFQWKDLKDICQNAGLIAISCMTHGIRKAIEVKKMLQDSIKCPFIIGGVHATLDPESVMDHFDLVYRGEGEDSIVELANRIGSDIRLDDIPGLWFRRNGKVHNNEPTPLRGDLNDYPIPDYDLGHQYILESDRLVPMQLSHIISDYFEVIGSRGCPHICAFCSNFKIKQEFPWRKIVRQYRVGYFIDHLKEICRLYPVIRSFWLEDDTFFAKDYDEIKEFAQRYKKEINRPFCILISPWTYSEEKVKLLVNAGMNRLILGVQSGSEHTNYNIYERRIGNEKMLAIIRSLNKFSDMLPYYDFIGMNPFEKSEDIINTIRFIKEFPSPFHIFSNNLAFYPGTKIRERAIEERLDVSKRDRHTDARHGYVILRDEKMRHKLFHFVFLMMGGKANKFMVGFMPRALISDTMLKFYCFLDKNFSFAADKFISLTAALLVYTDWKAFLKKRLNRRQIQKLKEFHRMVSRGT